MTSLLVLSAALFAGRAGAAPEARWAIKLPEPGVEETIPAKGGEEPAALCTVYRDEANELLEAGCQSRLRLEAHVEALTAVYALKIKSSKRVRHGALRGYEYTLSAGAQKGRLRVLTLPDGGSYAILALRTPVTRTIPPLSGGAGALNADPGSPRLGASLNVDDESDWFQRLVESFHRVAGPRIWMKGLDAPTYHQ